ncbi:DUF3142 domain-containing protein [Novosphingobium album (ex Hu et al. 2023)]|uniref:DUF3142 domain-containing protein n=1 Tax=Novosphingobium album (ex Hu et al. 2023) TaxID=2930093 RepID=A0ABT0AZY4_9SPHN|nr:DUF3142 domain-containing protein [Novosphingobium album (ex Hu et al. 2023)]MCJ2178094.1 DUF3142 domain-containing protein [Novosphingobium album (ex Hu et al. 2023)]
MGRHAQILLVSRRALLAGAAGGALALGGCRRGPAVVNARDHDAFFLWAGVRAPPWLDKARTVYLLAGEVRRADAGRFVPLRALPHVAGPEIWFVARVERLDWEEGVHAAILRQLAQWEAAGNRLAGLQIDFDAATHGLAGYARFLRGLRARLPAKWQLSITGLMDWSAGGDAQGLAALAGVVDEIVVQTYQGRRTVPGYESYLRSLQRLGMPYRIALVEGGEWSAPAGLEQDSRFKGYVVFLI